MVKNECSQCRKAKNRIANLLRSNPNYQNVITDDETIRPAFPYQQVSEFLEPKDYWPDVYAERHTAVKPLYDEMLLQPLIIEVDHETHKSKMATVKDKRRDKHFLSKKIPTIRFNLESIVGKKSSLYPDSDLMWLIEKEIEYQLR